MLHGPGKSSTYSLASSIPYESDLLPFDGLGTPLRQIALDHYTDDPWLNKLSLGPESVHIRRWL